MDTTRFARIDYWADQLNKVYANETGLPRPRGSGRQWLESALESERVLLGELSSPDLRASTSDIRAHLQLSVCLKKWRLMDDPQLETNAVKGFIARNSEVNGWYIRPQVLRIMRRLLDTWLPSLDTIPLPRMGPGAVAERMTWLQKRTRLPRIVSDLHDPFSPATTCDSITDHDCSRLCAVPKQWNKARLITIEPYFNTLAQQMARSYIWESLLSGPLSRFRCWRYFWDVMPDYQRRRALVSSVDHSAATIDLSDASDGISYDLVASVFPAHVMGWLDWSRTPTFDAGDGRRPLHIYAGMGNATTFIVETLIFKAYVDATAELFGVKSNCSVFGDDIICSNDLFMLGVLETGSPFFSINNGKSFGGHSRFRESCGVFAFDGEDVSPVRINGYGNSCGELQGLCDTVNQPRHRRFCESIIDDLDVPNLWVPFPGTLTTWSQSKLCDLHKIPTRWNKQYQRREWKLPVWEARTRPLSNKQGDWVLPAWFIQSITTESFRGNPSILVPLKGQGKLCQRWVSPTLA